MIEYAEKMKSTKGTESRRKKSSKPVRPYRATKRADSPSEFDLWQLIQRSAKVQPPLNNSTSVNNKNSQSSPQKITLLHRVLYLLRDLLSTVVWVYVMLKLFVFDIDIYLFNTFFPGAHWVLDFRFLILLILISFLALFFWRWTTIITFFYILLFPFVVLPWKFIMLLSKLKIYKSWIFWMVLSNVAVNFFKNFRYYIWSTGFGFVSLVLVVLSKNNLLLFIASACLAILLLISIARLIRNTFQPDWFLSTLLKGLNFVSSSFSDPVSEAKKLLHPLDSDNSVKSKEYKVLESKDLQTISSQIQLNIIATKFLYLAAYKLQQYRQLQIGFVFNLLSIGKFLFVSLIAFTAFNIVLFKIDPSQFKFDHYPTIIAMILYTLSSFAFNDGGGISPKGDYSYLLRIIIGIYDLFFVGLILINGFITIRNSKEETQLKEAVEELRKKARAQESEFRKILKVGFEEAFQKLVALGLGGMVSVFEMLSNAIPIEFIDKDTD